MARLPKSIIKKYGITKKAWQVFRGRKRKTKKAKPTRRYRRKRSMPRKRSRRRSFFSASSMFKYLRIAALVAPAVDRAVGPGTAQQKLEAFLGDYTGFWLRDGKWHPEMMARGWLPYLATTLVTHGIQKLTGIVRRL